MPTNLADARACKPSLLMISISSAGIAGLILSSKVAVANLDILQSLLQAFAESLGQIHRAVMTASAADPYGDIGAVAGGEAG